MPTTFPQVRGADTTYLASLPHCLLGADGLPVDMRTGAERIGIPVLPPITDDERVLRENAWREIQHELRTNDPRLLAWWVAVWTAPLHIARIRTMCQYLGIDPRRVEARAFRLGAQPIRHDLRLARVMRCLVLLRDGMAPPDVATLAGLATSNALHTLIRNAGYSVQSHAMLTSYGYAVRYMRDVVRPRADRLRHWMPFTFDPPLPRSVVAQYWQDVRTAEHALERARHTLQSAVAEHPVRARSVAA